MLISKQLHTEAGKWNYKIIINKLVPNTFPIHLLLLSPSSYGQVCVLCSLVAYPHFVEKVRLQNCDNSSYYLLDLANKQSPAN